MVRAFLAPAHELYSITLPMLSDFFIVANQQQPPSFMSTMLLFFLPMGILMYLIIIKPQKRKDRDHREMLKKLKAGTRVVTIGGIHGKVASVKETTVVLEIAPRVTIEVNRASIGEIVTDDAAHSEQTKK